MYQRNKLKQWITDGEGPTLDFKVSITSPAKIARSIVAFANSRGGKIVVGVEDKGFITGADIGGEEYELEKAASKFCDPPIELTFEQFEAGNKSVLIAYVEESLHKPHRAIDKKGRRRIYVRVADECLVANELITNILENGDLNNLQRNAQYSQLKRDLLGFLKKNQTIDIQGYMRWKKCTEKNAQRSLLDLLFEGFLTTKDFKLYKLGRWAF